MVLLLFLGTLRSSSHTRRAELVDAIMMCVVSIHRIMQVIDGCLVFLLCADTVSRSLWLPLFFVFNLPVINIIVFVTPAIE